MILNSLSRSFQRSLAATNHAKRTIKGYSDAVRYFDGWLERLPASYDEVMDVDPKAARDRGDEEFAALLVPVAGVKEITHGHIQAYMTSEIRRTSDSNANNIYRGLQQFWNWLQEEELIERNPFNRTKPPKVILKPVPVIQGDSLRTLLATCKGTRFVERRDVAIIMLFTDTGIRLSGCAGLDYREQDTDRDKSDLDLDQRVCYVTMKGGRVISVPFGRKTALALDRYLRVRAEYLQEAGVPVDGPLWIGTLRKGRLGGSGIAQMLKRRCSDAGLPKINPHRFRHTFAHEWRANGGDTADLMRLMGWESEQMAARYGASAADERARSAYHRSASPADRL